MIFPPAKGKLYSGNNKKWGSKESLLPHFQIENSLLQLTASGKACCIKGGFYKTHLITFVGFNDEVIVCAISDRAAIFEKVVAVCFVSHQGSYLFKDSGQLRQRSGLSIAIFANGL